MKGSKKRDLPVAIIYLLRSGNWPGVTKKTRWYAKKSKKRFPDLMRFQSLFSARPLGVHTGFKYVMESGRGHMITNFCELESA